MNRIPRAIHRDRRGDRLKSVPKYNKLKQRSSRNHAHQGIRRSRRRGYPQWNCNHPNSRRARQDDPAAPQRTQSSIAISADGEDWYLFNASPDLRQQINDNDILHPKKDLRHSPIMGAVLTNADVDHVAGLLNLRESQPLRIYATQRVLGVLQANSIFNVLNPKFVSREQIVLNEPLDLLKPDGSSMDIRVTPFAVPGKVALWLEDESKGKNFGSVDEDTIALYVEDTNNGKSFYYMPACARVMPELAEKISGADLISSTVPYGWTMR